MKDPLLYSETDEAVKRRAWLDRDDTRRVVESRAKTLRDQQKKGLSNPYKDRFLGGKKVPKASLKVGVTLSFFPPPHARAYRPWRGEVIALRGKNVVIDRSPALKVGRKQCNIEVIPLKECWIGD